MSGTGDVRHRLARVAQLRKLGLRRSRQSTTLSRQEQNSPQGGAAAQQSLNAYPDYGSESPAVQLPGGLLDTPFGPAWVRTARYPLTQHPALAAWLRVSPTAVAALDRNEALLGLNPASVAFIDTETTGLALDASTYTFLIGIGAYEPPVAGGSASGAFVVRQFFMRNPAEERAQLYLVEQALGQCSGIVSFNGRGFDMPLISNRFVLAGLPPPLPGALHLDLLPPARRLWHERWGSCRLGNLEHHVLGLDRTAEDVPGYLIPDIYRHFYRTEVVTELLVRVFYHNLQDIASMPLLAARMAQPFQEAPSSFEGLHPLECLSLGRCYAALGWTEASIAAYRAALSGSLASSAREQCLRELSFLYKRTQQRDLAVPLWEEWISTLPGEDLTPYIELAKHHEWHTGDLVAARGWAAWALRIREQLAPGCSDDEALADLRHRLARLESKLAGRLSAPAASEEA